MFMRRSKFKHVFGKPSKKEFCYEDIRITKSSWDARFCAVNPKYLAIVTESAGGGSFLVLPIEKVGRVERDAPLVAGHKGSVLDIQWCPHNDDLIASGSEDCTVKVWQIPEGGLPAQTNLTIPVADLVCHQRRVGLVLWHPTAEHILLSSGADNMVYLWNVATEEPLVEISFPDMVLSASFNFNGSKLVATCKDRHTRILNPRTGEIIVDGICHQGSKPQLVAFLKDNRIFTTGFSPMSERQYALWKDDNLTEPVHIQELDTSNGVMFPFYDSDTNLMYLCGKGDCTIRYFEITDEEPYVHFINMLTSSDPQRGMGWMPKRGLDVNQNEIARFYKLHAKGICEVIPFTVPRRSELFQDDLYPNTIGDTPSLTAEDWMAGKDADPVLISLKDGYKSKSKTNKIGGKLTSGTKSLISSRKETEDANKKTQSDSRVSSGIEQDVGTNRRLDGTRNSTTSETVNGMQSNSIDLKTLVDDIRKLKIIIRGHERRIKDLEDSPKVSENLTQEPTSISTTSSK